MHVGRSLKCKGDAKRIKTCTENLGLERCRYAGDRFLLSTIIDSTLPLFLPHLSLFLSLLDTLSFSLYRLKYVIGSNVECIYDIYFYSLIYIY